MRLLVAAGLVAGLYTPSLAAAQAELDGTRIDYIGVGDDGTILNSDDHSARYREGDMGPFSCDVYFPGRPVEEFTLDGRIGDTAFSVSNSTDSADGWTTDVGPEVRGRTIFWSGSFTRGPAEVTIEQVVRLPADDSRWFRVNVEITNTGTLPVSDLFYLRSGDPDQGRCDIGTSFDTTNDVVRQGPDDGGALVLASAGDPNVTFGVGAYVASARAHVNAMGGALTNTDADGTFMMPNDPDGSTADVAIGVVSRVGTLMPGDSATVSLIYVFGPNPETVIARYDEARCRFVAGGEACTVDGVEGQCRGGECCTGCWDGDRCQEGLAATSCGSAGDDCVACDDGNACTRDACRGGACAFPPVGAGEACDDGSACTTMDRCDDAGECAGRRRDCDDGLDCTTDRCDDATGACASSVSEGCAIDGMCVASGGVDPDDRCNVCDPRRDDTDWSRDPGCTGEGCESAADCDDPTLPACDTDTGVCVECTADDDRACAGRRSVCDDDTNTCVECTRDDASPCVDSPAGPRCLGRAGDYRCGCAEDDDCDATDVCTDAGVCVPDAGGDPDGDGVPSTDDADSDGDGIPDVVEGGGVDFSRDGDGDGVPDFADPDARGFVDEDGDGIDDRSDPDGDRIPSHLDLDSDGDGIPDIEEQGGGDLDEDGDGRVDDDTDADGDGLPAAVDEDDSDDAARGSTLEEVDTDGDGDPDFLDLDSDDDGLTDATEGGGDDRDGDGLLDDTADRDGNGLSDSVDVGQGGEPLPLPDTDDDGRPDYQDPDDDGDGISTADEVADGAEHGDDVDGDGLPNWHDTDSDADGASDEDEGRGDDDGDGIPNYLDDFEGVADAGRPGRDAGPAGDGGGDVDAGPPGPTAPGISGGAFCSATPGRGGDAPLGLLLLALGALLAVRRRLGKAVLGLLAAAALTASPAQAQGDAESVTLDHFAPAPITTDGFGVSRPTGLGHLRFGGQLYLDYSNDPLVVEAEQGDRDTEIGSIVEHQLALHLGLSLGLGDQVVVFAGLPIDAVMEGDDPSPELALDNGGAGLGDVRLGARARLVGDDEDVFALGLQATLTLPTSGGGANLRGDDAPSIHGEVLAEVRPGPVRVGVEAGVRMRDAVALGVNEIGHQLTWGVGATVPVLEGDLGIDAIAEIEGAFGFDGFGDREETPLEARVGGKLHHDSGITAGVAFGPGLSRGFGSPDLRLLAMAGWTRPEPAADEEPPPVGDRDGDGLLDPDDECPDEPEDADGFEDEDGCPDPDNDQDGVLDPDDGCPLEPEDADAFEDDDGCPDPDNDQDGLLDGADRCPNEAEDMDGLQDEDGCPEEDADEDTVLDAEDRCPMTPGVPNTDNADCHGCPARACVTATGQIVILERVEFATGRDQILPRSEPVLRDVHQILQTNTQIRRVRIEGHTDDRGRDAYNLDLSRRRAGSVRTWLRDQGVDAGRLESWGCGENVAIEPNRTRAGRQANRRVEFHIVDPAPPGGARSPEGCERLE